VSLPKKINVEYLTISQRFFPWFLIPGLGYLLVRYGL
jgi:hypothetical protein